MIEPDKFQRYISKAKELMALGGECYADAMRVRNIIIDHIDVEIALNGSGEQTKEWVEWLGSRHHHAYKATDAIPTIECHPPHTVSPPTGKTLSRSGD